MKIKTYLITASLVISFFTFILISSSAGLILWFANHHTGESFHQEISEIIYQQTQHESEMLFQFIDHLYQVDGLTRDEVIQEISQNKTDFLKILFLDTQGNWLMPEDKVPPLFKDAAKPEFQEVLRSSIINSRETFAYPLDFMKPKGDKPSATSIHVYQIYPAADLVVGVGTDYQLSLLRFALFQERNRRYSWYLILSVFLVFLLLGLPATYLMYRFLKARFIKPLYQIEEALASLEIRDFSHRLLIPGATELQIISRGFNSTASTLENNFREIERRGEEYRALNEHLEEKVRERTRELEEAYTKVQRLSITDDLTQMFNKRHFLEKGESQFLQCRRQQQEISVLMIDIDFFKPYNDTYGHLMGDEALQQVAQIIRSAIQRPGDLAARFGGEEFIILLSDTGEDGAAHIAERIINQLNASKIDHKTSQVADHVTVSIGSATEIPEGVNTLKELIDLADKALYEAKESGRNQHRHHA